MVPPSRLGSLLLITIGCAPLAALLVDGLAGELFGSASLLWAEHRRLPTLIGTSLQVTATALFTALMLGLPMGWICGRTNLVGRVWLERIAVPLALLPAYVVATGWIAVFGLEAGLRRPGVAGLIHGVGLAPLVWLATAAACRRLDAERSEILRLHTRSPLALFRVELPPLMPLVLSLTALAGLLVASDVSVTDIFMIRTLPGEVFARYQREGHGAGGLWLTLPGMVAFAFLARPLFRQLLHLVDPAHAVTHPPPPLPLGRLRGAVSGLAWGVIALVYAAPIGWLASRIDSPATAWQGLHASAPEWRHSLLGLLVAVPVILVAAEALAARLHAPRNHRWWALTGFLLATPMVLQGAGLIRLWNHAGPPGWIYDSPLVLVHAWLLRALPVAALLLLAARVQSGRDWFEAAALEGGSGWARRRLLGPPGGRAWQRFTAGVIAVLALGEVAASSLVVPPGWDTVTVRFFTLIHYSLYADVAVLALGLMAIALALATAGMVKPKG